MSQRRTISGRRSGLVWLSTLFALALVAIIVVVIFLIAPDRRRQQQLEAHYNACVTFQSAGDWDKASEECAQAVAIDGGYRDVQPRYAEVLSKQREATTTSRAVATTATANALEAHYQKGSAYMGMQRWEEAKAELGAVFEEDPNYKEVQAKLGEVEEKLAKIQALTPTAAPVTPTPIVVVSYNIAAEGRVEVSSVFPEQGGQCYHGSRAVDGVASGYPADPCREWATNGEGAGAWLKITFATPRHINQVVLYDRPNLDDHILGGTLSFSDDTTLRTGALSNDGSARRLVFEPKIVQWVQFTVDRADGPNTGLAEIEIYGW